MLTAYAATAASGEETVELTHLVEIVITKIPLWIAAFILLVCSFLAAKIARRIVENKLAEKGIEEDHKELQILGGRISYSIVLAIGITSALKIAGIDLTTILAAVAFGIGFALKDLIMNFLAGIMILVGRHFTIGDFIDIGGTVGKVVEIQSRVTVLQAIDGTKVIVPNADIFRKQVTSFTSNPFRRIEIEVGIDYRASIEKAMKICLHVAKNTKGVLLEPKPAVLVSGYGSSEIEMQVRVWVESTSGWLKIKSALLTNIKNAFDKYGIAVPYPITQLVYDKDMPIEEAEVTEDMLEADFHLAPELKVAPVPVTVESIPSAPITPQPADDKALKPLGEEI